MWQSSNTIRAGHMHHIALCCLEGSTPEDRSGADTQTAPVGRCMCGIPYPGCRFALPWAKCLLPFQGAYFAGLSSRTGVYLCLSPCDGCKDPGGVMMGLAENIQACLRIFCQLQHLWLVRDILHQPQGVYIVFVLLPDRGSRVQKFKGFNSVLSVLSVVGRRWG